MDDRHDIEKTLKQFRHDPDARVKQSVMSTYQRELSGREQGQRHAGLWRRPVPMYAAAAVLVLMVGLSFFAGQRMSISSDSRVAVPPSGAADGAVTAEDIEWSVAERDLL